MKSKNKSLILNNILFNAFIVITSILLFFGVIEIALRALDYKYDYPIKIVFEGEEWRDYHMYEDSMFQPDPYLLWKPKEGGKEYLRFNSKGYRGKEFTTDKKNNEYRILTIGDSNTLGPKEFSWPSILQQTLETRAANSNIFLVINAGVYGYTSLQGLRRFQESLKYKPDIVLISFGWNDAVTTTNKPDKAYGNNSKFFIKIKNFLSKNTKLYHLFKHLSQKYNISNLYKNDFELYARVSIKDYEKNLSEIIRIAKENKIFPVLLTRPNAIQKRPFKMDIHKWRYNLSNYNDVVRDIANREKIALVDAFSLFQNKEDIFIDDSHLNKKGAAILAEHILPIIQ